LEYKLKLGINLMRNLIKLWLCTVSVGLILTGCSQTPTERVEFENIRSCSFEEYDPEKGTTNTVTISCDQERAEVDTFDSDSSSNIPPTQHITVSDKTKWFHHYDLHGQDKVVYSVENGSNNPGYDLWVSNGRTGKIRLTNTKYNHWYPSFSRNGKYVYFTSRRGKRSSNKSYMWRMAANGSGGLTRIGHGAYHHTQAVQESPNGQYILYSSKEYRGRSTIWYARKNGTVPTQLTVGTSAVWLDNDTIMYELTDRSSDLSSIWKMKLDGSEKTLIISEPKSDVIHVTPSPDRNKLAYVTQARYENGVKDRSSRDIWIVDLITGSPMQITTNKSQDKLPKWSSDGKKLFFASSRGVNWNVWKMNVANMFGEDANSYDNGRYQKNNSNKPNNNPKSDRRSNKSEDDSPWEPSTFEVDDGFKDN